MLTTRSIFEVGVTKRYRILSIRDDATVFVRILTSGDRMRTYTRALRIILFRTGDLLSDIVLVNTLTKLLTHSTYLHTLLIDVTDESSTFVEAVIECYGLVRRPQTMHEIIGTGHCQPCATKWLLPSLRTLILGRGLGMISLAYFRSITHLWISQTLSKLDLQLLLTVLAKTAVRDGLESLGIAFDASTSPRELLLALSHTRVNVRVLSITQRHINLHVCSISINSTVAAALANEYALQSLLIGLNDPHVHFLFINHRNSGPPIVPRSQLTQIEDKTGLSWLKHMLDYPDRHSTRLRWVQFGTQRWEARPDDQWWPYPSPDTLFWWEDKFGRALRSDGHVINTSKVARVLVSTWVSGEM